MVRFPFRKPKEAQSGPPTTDRRLKHGPAAALPPLPDHHHVHAARAIVERLKQAGHEAYFVGGFVRDWLLRLNPIDVDIATSAHPEDVQKLFEHTRAVGAHFGVVLVTHEGETIEVATFRTDLSYKDSRRPEGVRYGTLEEDAVRRDFTINALYYDPVEGKVKDLVEGMLDLRRRMLRTVGPAVKRFQEDALRLMRAVRFAVRYELEIEERTRKAIVMRAKNLDNIAKERVGQELLKILTGPHRGRAVRLMADLGIWEFTIPELMELKGVQQGTRYHPEGDAFEHVALAMDSLPENPAPELALGVLLHDIAKGRTVSRDDKGIHFYGHADVGAQMARDICNRLKYSRETTEAVYELVRNHMIFMDVNRMKPAKLKRFVGREDFPTLLLLHRADALASDGDLSAYDFCIQQHDLLEAEHGPARKPEPLASGEDLIAMGLKPGPAFSDLLDALHDEQLEGRIATRDEAIAFLRERAAQLPDDASAASAEEAAAADSCDADQPADPDAAQSPAEPAEESDADAPGPEPADTSADPENTDARP